MKKILMSLVFAFAVIVISPQSSDAETNEVAMISQVESYLNSLKTYKARFTQTSYDGSEATGDFYLKRPGRLRFEYDDPIQDFIVADGVFIYYYDSEMKQQSNTTIGNSLADFLLREDVSLGGDIMVDHIQRGGGLLQIKLVMAEDPGAGSLTLGLSENPLKLEKWRVTDSQGLITEIALDNIETGIKLDRDLFFYIDPEHGKPQYN